MEAALLCFDGGFGASFFGWAVFDLAGVGTGWSASFLGWVDVDLAGVIGGLVVGVEDLEGAGAGFFGWVDCLHDDDVEGGLVFLGGNLGIFFFCSGMIQMVVIYNVGI